MTDIEMLNIPLEILNLVPKATAAQLSVLPIGTEGDAVVVALAEDHDAQVMNDLAFMLGKKVKPHTVQRDVLVRAIRKHYGLTEIENRKNTSVQEFLSVKDSNDDAVIHDSTSDGSTVGLVNRIITDAIGMGASDIHVEPYERSMRVRYRLDGVLHEVLKPNVAQAKAIISRLKIMADLDIAEKRRPQDGRIRVKEGERIIDIRVSTLPTDFGEKVVLRILDKSQLQLDLTRLGFEEEDLRQFQRTVRLPYGMILVTGPTGSGKTTTLYAALNSINSPDMNITTIEDPIEYNLPGINQTHVRAEIGLTFAAALRSILRQDPNVIMVGEIRDAETAEIAVRSALTGHLVFSTLHTNDAPSAITRLIDMGVEPFLVASSVKMILAQRLLRRLCDACKVSAHLSVDQLREIGLQQDSHSATFYCAKGCSSCHHSGYNGRMAVYEILPINNGLSDLIARGSTASELRSKARENGFRTLREAAIARMTRGETSCEEVVRETAS